MEPIILKTPRLTLRPLGLEDLETVHAYASNRENTRYMYYLPNDTLEETTAFLQSVSAEWRKAQPDFYEFAIVCQQQQIGAVSLYLDDSRTEGELGWILHHAWWGNGYATEAAIAVRDFGRELRLKRLIAHCDCRNRPSQRVMEKLGMALTSDSGTRIYPKTGETAKEQMYTLTLSPKGGDLD